MRGAVIVAVLVVAGCGVTSAAARQGGTSAPVDPAAVAAASAPVASFPAVCEGPAFDWSVAPELVRAWGAFWNEPGRVARSEVLNQIWAEGASYTDPFGDGPITDREALLDAAEFGMGPGQFIEMRAWDPDDLHHDRVRMRWRHCCPSLNSYLHGTDIGWIDAAGRFDKIVSFWAKRVDVPADEAC